MRLGVIAELTVRTKGKQLSHIPREIGKPFSQENSIVACQAIVKVLTVAVWNTLFVCPQPFGHLHIFCREHLHPTEKENRIQAILIIIVYRWCGVWRN